jgi:hypothetical protein
MKTLELAIRQQIVEDRTDPRPLPDSAERIGPRFDSPQSTARLRVPVERVCEQQL